METVERHISGMFFRRSPDAGAYHVFRDCAHLEDQTVYEVEARILRMDLCRVCSKRLEKKD